MTLDPEPRPVPRKLRTLARLGALLALAGCSTLSGGAADGDDPADIVLARLDGEDLTLQEAMDTFLSSHSGHGVLVQGEPAVRELVGRLVEMRLFRAEAEALRLREDPELRAAVDERRRALAERAFWQREVKDRVSVPDEEVEEFYDKTDYALRITLIESVTRERAAELRERVATGADMEDLAQEESIHETSSFGGLLPFVRRGDLEPALEEPAFALGEPGSMTPVVATAAGFAFARLEERIENPNRPSRDVALPQIRGILEERVEDELRAEVEARIDAEAGVSVDAELLTRDALLSAEHGEAVVARAADEELSLDGLREMLDLEAIRAAEADRVAQALPEIVGTWTRKRSFARALETSGLLEDSGIASELADYEEDLLMTFLQRDYVYGGAELTEEQLRAYWEEHRDTEFTRPPEVRLAYIVVNTAEAAEEVVTRARSGEDFENLAREFSIDPRSSVHGGRIGWVRPGQLLEAVEEPSFAASAGDLVGPVETELGTFIVKILDRREPQLVPFERARGAVAKRLAKEVRRELYASWAERLRERAEIDVDDDGIARAVAWLAAEEARRAALEPDEPAEVSPDSPHAPPPSPVIPFAPPEEDPEPSLDAPAGEPR